MARRVILALLLAWAAPALATFDENSYSTGSFADTSFDFEGGGSATVPDCTGDDEATCVSEVEGEGLVAQVQTRCSGVVAMGDVIGTVPDSGASVEAGSTVVISVSNGEACASGKGRRLGIGIGLGGKK